MLLKKAQVMELLELTNEQAAEHILRDSEEYKALANWLAELAAAGSKEEQEILELSKRDREVIDVEASVSKLRENLIAELNGEVEAHDLDWIEGKLADLRTELAREPANPLENPANWRNLTTEDGLLNLGRKIGLYLMPLRTNLAWELLCKAVTFDGIPRLHAEVARLFPAVESQIIAQRNAQLFQAVDSKVPAQTPEMQAIIAGVLAALGKAPTPEPAPAPQAPTISANGLDMEQCKVMERLFILILSANLGHAKGWPSLINTCTTGLYSGTRLSTENHIALCRSLWVITNEKLSTRKFVHPSIADPSFTQFKRICAKFGYPENLIIGGYMGGVELADL